MQVSNKITTTRAFSCSTTFYVITGRNEHLTPNKLRINQQFKMFQSCKQIHSKYLLENPCTIQ